MDILSAALRSALRSAPYVLAGANLAAYMVTGHVAQLAAAIVCYGIGALLDAANPRC